MLKIRPSIALKLLLLAATLGMASSAGASVKPRLVAPQGSVDDVEPWGAEGASSEDDQPRIPEPMVFDLMRPLGAHQGELEANVLGLFPIASRGGANGIPDALGLPGNGVEWAPEVEYALLDGFTLELELPFENTRVAAYKGGVQWTFGKALGNTFIHGAQLIVEYEREPASWLPTLTYLAGLRIDEIWSVFGMFGFRGITNPEHTGDELDGIMNVSVFADVAPQVTLGVETNLSESLGGKTNFLLMPPVHWEMTDHTRFQGGIGARITDQNMLTEASVRLVHSF
jgi:hypothetical protein